MTQRRNAQGRNEEVEFGLERAKSYGRTRCYQPTALLSDKVLSLPLTSNEGANPTPNPESPDNLIKSLLLFFIMYTY